MENSPFLAPAQKQNPFCRECRSGFSPPRATPNKVSPGMAPTELGLIHVPAILLGNLELGAVRSKSPVGVVFLGIGPLVISSLAIREWPPLRRVSFAVTFVGPPVAWWGRSRSPGRPDLVLGNENRRLRRIGEPSWSRRGPASSRGPSSARPLPVFKKQWQPQFRLRTLTPIGMGQHPPTSFVTPLVVVAGPSFWLPLSSEPSIINRVKRCGSTEAVAGCCRVLCITTGNAGNYGSTLPRIRCKESFSPAYWNRRRRRPCKE